MKHLKLIFTGALLILNSTFLIRNSVAQCLQIESILVDACVSGGGCSSTSGPCTCEGRNEMVLFKVLGTAINTASLTPTWPNNGFKGWKKNAQTAANVATLNATIVKCGFLKEPVGGILPANKEVLIITSWDMCTGANSFANLQDTLIVLFQDTNNFQGHFVNQNNGTTVSSVPTGPVLNRTLTLSYPPLACSRSVTYQPHLLVNNLGTYGGTGAQNDGATVLFDALGNATYVNNGCRAPYIPITANATAPSTVCVNASANISGSISGPSVSYSWTTSGTGIISVPTGTLSGTGSATVNTTYTPGSGESGIVTFTLSAQGKCSLAVTTNTVSINVIAFPSPSINSSNGITVCFGSSTVLSVIPVSGTTYLWNPGSGSGTSFTVTPTSQTIYTVAATNACATINATYTVGVNALPIINVNSPSTCPGAVTIITASGGVSYSWNTGQTGTSISVPGTATSYTVTGTGANGCKNTAVASVSLLTLPISQVISGISVICEGQNTTFSVTPGSYNYSWSGPLGSIGNGTSITTGQPGVYTLTATNACGSAQSTFTVTASLPEAAFTTNVLSGQAPVNVVFTNTSTGTLLQNYWNFANGDTSRQLNINTTYTAAGSYNATLIVTDSYGCRDTANVIIVVSDVSDVLIIPNIFSPNRDNINDVFMVTAAGITNFNCKIYDRWGILLYEWSDIKGGWDGKNTSNGKDAADGTYYFLITYIDNKAKSVNKPGYLQLVR